MWSWAYSSGTLRLSQYRFQTPETFDNNSEACFHRHSQGTDSRQQLLQASSDGVELFHAAEAAVASQRREVDPWDGCEVEVWVGLCLDSTAAPTGSPATGTGAVAEVGGAGFGSEAGAAAAALGLLLEHHPSALPGWKRRGYRELVG